MDSTDVEADGNSQLSLSLSYFVANQIWSIKLPLYIRKESVNICWSQFIQHGSLYLLAPPSA